MSKYDDVAEGVRPGDGVRPGEERETLVPFRPPSLESDVGVPLGTAAVFGVGVASLLCLLSVATRWPAGLTFTDYLLAWTIFAIFITLAVFAWRTLWLQQTIMRWERQTGRDLPGGYRGGPPLLNPSAARKKAGEIVVDRETLDEIERLTQFMHACTSLGTSEAKLGVGTAPAARAAYMAQRDALMQLGLARWKKAGNPRAGWELTTTPQQARAIIEQHVVRRA